MANSKNLSDRRAKRTRSKIRKNAIGRPRLSVFRSGRHIYAQIIDDKAGCTLAAASTLDQELRGKMKNGSTIEAAGTIGKLVAERAVAKGVKDVVFDRGGYRFHGRVQALADGAREAGLSF